jgi:hypothetical protein
MEGGCTIFEVCSYLPAEFITLFFKAIYYEEMAVELLGLYAAGPKDTEFFILRLF